MSIFDIDFHNLRDVRAHVEKEMEREAANPPAATTDDGKDRGAFPTERFPSPLPDGLWSIRPEHNPKNDAPAPTPAHAPATLSPPLMPLTFPPPPPLREDDPTWLAKMAADVQRQRAHLHTALAHARAEATAALVEATLVQTELQEEGRAMQRFLAKVSVVAGKRFVEKLVKEVEREMKGVGSDVEGREGEDEGAEDEDDSQGDGEDDAPEDDDDGDSDGSDDDDNDEGLYVPHGTKAPNPPNTSTNDNDSDSGSQAQHPNIHHVPRAPLRLFGGNEPRGGAVPHPLLQQPLRNDERPDAGPSNSNGAGKSAHNAPGPAEQSAAGPSNHNAAGSSTLDAERPSNTNGAEPSNDHAAGPSNRHIPGPSNRRLPGVFRRNERVMRCEDDFNRDSSSSSSSDGENTQPMRNAPPPQELNGWPQGPSSNFYGQPIFQPHYFARDLAQPYGAAMREQAAVMSPYRRTVLDHAFSGVEEYLNPYASQPRRVGPLNRRAGISSEGEDDSVEQRKRAFAGDEDATTEGAANRALKRARVLGFGAAEPIPPAVPQPMTTQLRAAILRKRRREAMEEGQVDADGELQWLGLGATQEPPPRRVKLQFFRPAAGKGKGKENAADIGKGKGKEKASDENDDDDTRQRKRPRTSSGWFSWLTGSSPASGARASTSRAGPSQFYQEEPWRPNWGFSAATAAWFATPDPDPAQLPGPSQRARSPSPELEYVDDDSAAHESDRDPLDED